MSDAQDRLRQYLEQRRELGEREFVLDNLSVEEALKVLTGKAAAPARQSASGARREASAPQDPPRGQTERHRAAEEAAAGGDWREALRAVDAREEETKSSKPAKAATHRKAATEAKSATQRPAASATSAATDGSPAPTAPDVYTRQITPAPSGREDLADLAAVAATIATCRACSLGETATHPVPGEGNPSAGFVVVGEAPGQKEDELGRPFVGKSGDLLTKILEAVGFKREDVFICNVLKHRPPGNRNPSADEIVACRPFLLRQLELLQPKVILALGTFAAQTLLETDSPIGKLRGLEHRYHGIPLVATYHPAALLRNPNWKRPAWEDVQLARRIFDRP